MPQTQQEVGHCALKLPLWCRFCDFHTSNSSLRFSPSFFTSAQPHLAVIAKLLNASQNLTLCGCGLVLKFAKLVFMTPPPSGNKKGITLSIALPCLQFWTDQPQNSSVEPWQVEDQEFSIAWGYVARCGRGLAPSLIPRHETSNSCNSTVRGPICTKLRVIDNYAALKTSVWL